MRRNLYTLERQAQKELRQARRVMEDFRTRKEAQAQATERMRRNAAWLKEFEN